MLILDMLNKYYVSGINLTVTDFTFKVGIPSVGVLAYDSKTFPKSSEIVWTAGTAPDPQKALSRALTEVAQLAGDFNTGSNYVSSGLPKFSSIAESGFVADTHRNISMFDLPNISDMNIRIEVENCVNALKNLNMETIVVDTTHPILKVPVFYTIVPGTHFRERAANTSVAMFSAKIAAESFIATEAISRLKDMDRLLPGKYFIQFYIGKCYLELNQHDVALSYFSRALELDPNEQNIPSIYSYLGVCLKEMNRYEEAIQVLKKGEQIDDERTDIHNLKGFCYFMLKNYEKAIESFTKVIYLDPSSAIDYANIASNYRDMGKKDEAVRYYRLALEIDPSIEFAVKNLDILTSK
jgi:ribosomal protein S12 methylthiotransferase accessory factor